MGAAPPDALLPRPPLPPGGAQALLQHLDTSPRWAGVMRVVRAASSMLGTAAAEFHLLPHGSGAPTAALLHRLAASALHGAGGRASDGGAAASSAPSSAQAALGAVDLLALLQPNLPWWQRFCCAANTGSQLGLPALVAPAAQALLTAPLVNLLALAALATGILLSPALAPPLLQLLARLRAEWWTLW